MATRVSSSGQRSSSSGSSSSKTSSSSSTKKVNYNFDSRKESASQYNSRIAKERGDSASSLKSMQKVTSDTYSKKGLDASKVNGGVITADRLAPVPPPPTLPPPPVQPFGDLVGPNNVGLASGLADSGVSLDTNGQFVVQPQKEEDSDLASIFKEYASLQTAPPNTADIYNAEYKAAGIKQKQQEVNQYTAQLNSIVAKQKADQLAIEGQGRGIPEVIIGGQQAQINKEAAIAALPVQAQLAAAQGNLEMAQQHLDTMFKIKSQDALNRYNYQNKVIDMYFDYATKEEQRKFDSIKEQKAQAYAETQKFYDTQHSLLSQAVQQGAPASVQNAIRNAKDISSAIAAAGEWGGDMLGRQIKQAQLRELNAPKGTAKRDTQVVDGKLIDMQTGEVVSNLVGGNIDGQKLSETQNNLRRLATLANETNKLAGASGLGLFNRAATFFTGDSKYARLSNNVDTLKTNLLTLNTDPAIKKFFGPQMSNRDTELMVSAGSTLNSEKQSADDMRKELVEYQDFIKRAQGWTYLGTGQPLTVTLIDPRTKEQQEVTVNYDTLSQAVQDGLQVKF